MNFAFFYVLVTFYLASCVEGNAVPGMRSMTRDYDINSGQLIDWYDCIAQGNYPDPRTCDHYIACTTALLAYQMPCAIADAEGNRLHYVRDSGPNEDQSYCDWPENVNCDISPPANSTTLPPTTTTSKPVTSTSQPPATTSQPATSTSQSPTTTTSEPVTSTSQPPATTSQPATSTSQAPTTTTSEPVTSTSQAPTTTSKPITSTSQAPTTTTSKPVTSTSQAPTTTTSKPVTSTSQPPEDDCPANGAVVGASCNPDVDCKQCGDCDWYVLCNPNTNTWENKTCDFNIDSNGTVRVSQKLFWNKGTTNHGGVCVHFTSLKTELKEGYRNDPGCKPRCDFSADTSCLRKYNYVDPKFDDDIWSAKPVPLSCEPDTKWEQNSRTCVLCDDGEDCNANC